MDEDVEIHLIVSRPILATTQALIDVSNDRMVLRVGDDEVIFRLLETMRHSMGYDHTCYFIDVNDMIIFEHM